jgi:hypothetical protein
MAEEGRGGWSWLLYGMCLGVGWIVVVVVEAAGVTSGGCWRDDSDDDDHDNDAADVFSEHILSVEDQEALRGLLQQAGAVAFVRNGAILPRAGG